MIIRQTITLAIIMSLSGFGAKAQIKNPNKLWYTKPAGQFEEALPLGNGRLGVMVYGGVKTEKLALNEETLWAGGPMQRTTCNR